MGRKKLILLILGIINMKLPSRRVLFNFAAAAAFSSSFTDVGGGVVGCFLGISGAKFKKFN